jgi:hypothetical protein
MNSLELLKEELIKPSNNYIVYDMPMHNIYEKYVMLFESLGWIILAHYKKDTVKTTFYCRMLKQFKKNVENKESKVKDLDKKDDFKIMIRNLESLIIHSEKDFKNNNESRKVYPIPETNLANKNIVEYDVTKYGLRKWYHAMISKLGWLVIADKNGDKTKIKEYGKTLVKLYKSLMKKKESFKNENRKTDVDIMMNDIEIIYSHFKYDFMKNVNNKKVNNVNTVNNINTVNNSK